MITIEYSSSRNGRHDLQLMGHACYNPGNDIVCASVSAITYTLMGYLNNSEADYTAHFDSGDCAITCERTRDTDTAIKMAVIGYAQIAMSYPDNVTIHIADADGWLTGTDRDITKGA